MHTLTFQQFSSLVRLKEKELRKLLNVDLPKIIGKEAVDIFEESFHTESWNRKSWTLCSILQRYKMKAIHNHLKLFLFPHRTVFNI